MCRFVKDPASDSEGDDVAQSFVAVAIAMVAVLGPKGLLFVPNSKLDSMVGDALVRVFTSQKRPRCARGRDEGRREKRKDGGREAAGREGSEKPGKDSEEGHNQDKWVI